MLVGYCKEGYIGFNGYWALELCSKQTKIGIHRTLKNRKQFFILWT
jgi:hypothetical protein